MADQAQARPARRRPGPVRPVDIDGPPGDIADVVGEDGQDSERGLEAGIIGVQIAKVIEINILQIRTGFEVRLVEVHGDQAALGVGAQPRTVFIRVGGPAPSGRRAA